MSNDLSMLTEGMEVFGSDGQPVGTVKDVPAAAFVVRRAPLTPDVTVPATAIEQVTAGRVTLTATAAGVDDMWWAHAGEDAEIDTTGQYD